MKNGVKAVFCGMAALLLTGCVFDEEFIEAEYTEPAETSAAETTLPDLSRYTLPRITSGPSGYDGTVPDYSEPAETETTAVTSGADPAETTEGTAAGTAAGETAASAEETTASSAQPEPAVIPAQYRLSGLRSVTLLCAEDPSDYCKENVFDLTAAGFRSDGTAYVYTAAGGAAVLRTGALLPDTEDPLLQTICYTFGEQRVTVDQRSPAKAAYKLPDGTAVTTDQLVLLVYLREQLAADPTQDPLAERVPLAFQETIGNETFYYLP